MDARENISVLQARVHIVHTSPEGKVLLDEWVENVKTYVGYTCMLLNCYSTTPGANGLNYIAFSNTASTSFTINSTSPLTGEIADAGLARAQGTYAHTAGTLTASVTKAFTNTSGGAVAVKTCALFNLAALGYVQHIVGFTPQVVANGATISVTFAVGISLP